MKVAVYSGVIPTTIFIENLLNALSENNIQVFIFGKKKSVSYIEDSKFKFIYTPKNKFKKVIFVVLQGLIFLVKSHKYFFKIYKYYNSISKKESGGLLNWLSKVLPVINNLPDIFHIQWAKSLPFWFFLKDIFGIKIIVSLRGAHINYSPLNDYSLKLSYMKLFPKVDKFHSVSDAIATVAQRYGAKKQDIQTIYSALNIKDINIVKLRKTADKSSFSFISVGRSHWKKGYQYSISAFDKINSLGHKATYTICLSEDPSEEILYQINDLKLNQKIKIITGYDQNKIYRKIKNSDCLILPSVEEGIANVVLESMALGTLVISSDCGGMTEVIQNNKNGLLFSSRNVNELTDKMISAIKLKDSLKTQIISNALKISVNNHNLFSLGYKMKKLYQNTLYESS